MNETVDRSEVLKRAIEQLDKMRDMEALLRYLVWFNDKISSIKRELSLKMWHADRILKASKHVLPPKQELDLEKAIDYLKEAMNKMDESINIINDISRYLNDTLKRKQRGKKGLEYLLYVSCLESVRENCMMWNEYKFSSKRDLEEYCKRVEEQSKEECYKTAKELIEELL